MLPVNRFTYVVIDKNASSGRERKSNRHQNHPVDEDRHEHWVGDAGIVEYQHIEKDDEAGELTAERRRVMEHERVVDSTDCH